MRAEIQLPLSGVTSNFFGPSAISPNSTSRPILHWKWTLFGSSFCLGLLQLQALRPHIVKPRLSLKKFPISKCLFPNSQLVNARKGIQSPWWRLVMMVTGPPWFTLGQTSNHSLALENADVFKTNGEDDDDWLRVEFGQIMKEKCLTLGSSLKTTNKQEITRTVVKIVINRNEWPRDATLVRSSRLKEDSVERCSHNNSSFPQPIGK